MKPISLKIFLPEGEATGTKIVELSNWTGKGFFIPRNKLQEILKTRPELASQSVYFLIGDTDEGKKKVYIGEAENLKERIEQHHKDKNKDFWNVVICFISKDENLTKAHVKFLEALLTKELLDAKRVEPENRNTPPAPKLPEADIAEMHIFASNLKMIISTLGYYFLEKLSENKQKEEEMFYCKGKGVEARGIVTNEGFVILKNSTISGKEVDSVHNGISIIRNQILNSDKAEKLANSDYKLLEDIVFSSPSYAAGFVLGSNQNGWLIWKDKDNKTLDEIKRNNK